MCSTLPRTSNPQALCSLPQHILLKCSPILSTFDSDILQLRHYHVATMPPAKRPLPDDEGDIWDRHQKLLQRLYETERKTLEDVKQIMEAEHGFPDIPLSTYEAKLRDKLHLRKKLKKTDWPVIYQHHLRRGGKDSAVHLNGSLIPWKKAWKEIRRSGAHLTEQESLSLGALPRGVTIRTPPPTQHKFIAPATEPGSESNVHTSLTTVSRGLRTPSSQTVSSIPESFIFMSNYASTRSSIEPFLAGTTDLETTGSVYRLCLVSTPYHELLSKLDLNPLSRGSHAANAPGQISVGIGTSFPREAQNQELGSNFDTYHLLAKVLFVVSNKTLDEENAEGVMDTLLTKIPKSVLFGLLDSGIPTLRGAWETLVDFSYKLDRKDDFSLLLKIAERHPDWIRPAASKYLSYAASFGCLTSIKHLLAEGAQPDAAFPQGAQVPILQALYSGHRDAARIMFKHYDVNRRIWSQPAGECSAFDIHLWEFFTFAKDEMSDKVGLVMDMFLEAGADVVRPWKWPQDYRCRQCICFKKTALAELLDRASLRNNSSWPMPMTWLDYAYYSHGQTFRKFDRYSTQNESEITRVGICTAASQSTASLRQYLQSRPPWTPESLEQLLECILSELFYCKPQFNLSAIQNMIEYGVDVRVPSMSKFEISASSLLDNLIQTVRKHGCSPGLITVTGNLLQAGAVINSGVLRAAVEEEGFFLIELLTDTFGVNIPESGAEALEQAVHRDNFEAVKWLIRRGADIKDALGYTHIPRHIYTVIAAINYIFDHEPDQLEEMRRNGWEAATPEMQLYLNEQAARLKFTSFEIIAFNFLRHTFEHDQPTFNWQNTRLQQEFQGFLETGLNLDDDPGSEENVLESCLVKTGAYDLGLFELLLERGAPVWPGSPLPALIDFGGSHDLIQKVITAGADINKPSSVYRCGLTPLQAACRGGDLELANSLLQRGANIDAPGIKNGGRTALQYACEWRPRSTEGEQRRTRLIRLLVDRGADVNSKPAPYSGQTALQMAAIYGDLETAIFLLERKADINAPAGDGGYCALDGAARNGRLDMVKFLLNANALSQKRGSTGYDGAIKCAEEGGHFAVADLFRKHAADNVGCGNTQSQQQESDEEESLYNSDDD